MPPICLHLSIAKEAAAHLCYPVIGENLGAYLFGATLPDVHIITGGCREETHFFDLEQGTIGSVADLFFEKHPHLAQRTGLNERAMALIAGYLSHLVTDEIWIVDIYRPFFGPSSSLSGDPMANILDRVLQYELDCRERDNKANMSQICSWLSNQDLEVDIGLVDTPTLRQWQEFVCVAAARGPTWERFPVFARRFLSEQAISPEQMEQMLASLPSMVERALQHVPREQIGRFREKAVSQSVALAEEYLG